MRIKFILFCISLIAIFDSCSNDHSSISEKSTIIPQRLLDSNYHKKNFDSLLSNICKGKSNLDITAELLANSNFRVIYEHSPAYLEDAIRKLSNGNFTTMEAEACIYGMQNLQLIDYIDFCRFYLQLYNDNKVSEGMLKEVILPNFLQVRIIPKNSNDSNVVALLNKIKANERISIGFKNDIVNVLSGKYEKEIEGQ